MQNFTNAGHFSPELRKKIDFEEEINGMFVHFQPGDNMYKRN